jgi:hypothetical protein
MREASSHKSFDLNDGISQNRQNASVVPTYPLATIHRL